MSSADDVRRCWIEPRSSTRRLGDLESAFVALEPKIPAGPVKDAISILHGMVQEMWRNLNAGRRQRGRTA